MAFDPDLAIRQLVEIYRAAYLRLLEIIATKEARGRATGFERALLADVNAILLELDRAAKAWAAEVIPRVYTGSAETVYEAWLAAGLTPPAFDARYAQVHQAAIEALVANFQDQLDDAHRFVGRRIRDQWRRAQLEVVAEKISTGRTVREAKLALQERVAAEGLGAFRDAKGRIWRLDAYAEMVARTTTAEATNAGLLNQLRGMGRDLVQLTQHRSPCPICAPYEGRVYSISGKDKRYPPLSVVPGFDKGYQTLHPNCRHRASPYVEELADDPEGDRIRSNRPFEDRRSEAEKRAYEREQERNRLRRERRKLEQQLAVLPPGEERDRVLERLRTIRSEQRALGREQREYLDEIGT